MNRNEYSEAIKSIFISILRKKAQEYIRSKLLSVGLSFLNPVAAYLFNKVFDKVIDEPELAIFFVYTDFRVNRQESELDDLISKYINDRSEENEKNLIDSFNRFSKWMQ